MIGSLVETRSSRSWFPKIAGINRFATGPGEVTMFSDDKLSADYTGATK